MRRQEKRRKFHDALLNTLYPPPPLPQAGGVEEKPLTPSSNQDFDVLLIPDDYGLRLEESGGSSTSGGEDGDVGIESRKLSRAQRKRLRKKKLKEEVSRRGQIIGPLLPPSRDHGDGLCEGAVADTAVRKCTPSVRQNAADDVGASDKLGEQRGVTNQNKAKQRRMAKRLARESLKSTSNVETLVQDQSLKPPIVAETCDQDTP